MKRGFTLIELLAVIVILAIIALIATPIVLNIIDETKDSATLRSAEFYLNAVEQSILSATLNNRGITDGVYNIESGNLCIDKIENECKDELVIEIKGEKINSGSLIIQNGKIEDIVLNLNDKTIIKNENEELFIIEPTPIDCFKYTNNADETISITGYSCGGQNGTHKDVVIPEKINGKFVTVIDGAAFNDKQLTRVIIPNGIITIGDYVFGGNKLTRVIIPNGVKAIGAYAFSGNKLTRVIIPDSVTTMGDSAFAKNELTSVIISKNITSISARLFSTNKLNSVDIPDGVKVIAEAAFYKNQLTRVIIPDSVTTIGTSAFSSNQLTTLIIPNGVKIIGLNSFRNNQLISVTIPESVTKIDAAAFYINKLTSATIPQNVTVIGAYAFDENALTSVVIKGKSSTANFNQYGNNAFGWADGYSDANITWQPN